jgi:hypothetical protein
METETKRKRNETERIKKSEYRFPIYRKLKTKNENEILFSDYVYIHAF